MSRHRNVKWALKEEDYYDDYEDDQGGYDDYYEGYEEGRGGDEEGNWEEQPEETSGAEKKKKKKRNNKKKKNKNAEDSEPSQPSSQPPSLQTSSQSISSDDIEFIRPEPVPKTPVIAERPVIQSKSPSKSPSVTPSLSPSLSSLKIQHKPARHEELRAFVETKNTEKPGISIVVIGHVDAGKSTTVGHLLVNTGKVSAQQIRKLQNASKTAGKASFAYAWVLDEHEEERSRGVTVDVGTASFETEKLKVTLLDAPGHRDFIPNMISGTQQADAAILVLSAAPGDFEAGFCAQGQTKEHLSLAKALGIRQLIVAVNQLDRSSWDKERYDQVVSTFGEYLSKIGFLTDGGSVQYVPISGLLGVNLTKSDKTTLKWYDGPTLIEAIDSLVPPLRDIERPFCLSVSDMCKTQTGFTVCGRCETGFAGAKDNLLLLPAAEQVVVKAISVNNKPVDVVSAGDNAELVLQSSSIDVSLFTVGSILCDPSSPVPLVTKFTAQIFTYRLDFPLLPGQQCILYGKGSDSPAIVRKLNAIISRETGEVVRRKPRNIFGEGVIAEVDIVLSRPLCLQTPEDSVYMSRFTLHTNGYLMATGIVKKISKK